MLKVIFNIFNPLQELSEIIHLASYNKVFLASRKQYKNFAKMISNSSTFIYELIRYTLNRTIKIYVKQYKEENKERNILLIQPALETIFQKDLKDLFNKYDILSKIDQYQV
jgi:hypothetical protein